MICEAIIYKHVLVPTDGSDLAQVGVLRGLELAKEHGAKVTAMMATEAPGGQFAFAACPSSGNLRQMAALI